MGSGQHAPRADHGQLPVVEVRSSVYPSLTEEMLNAQRRYVHGERIILPTTTIHAADTENLATITMYDFNVYPKRLDDPCPMILRVQSAVADVIEEGTPIVADAVFVAPVVTRLPFLLVRTQQALLAPDYSGFMIDHEHLVGMRVRVPCHSVRVCAFSDVL